MINDLTILCFVTANLCFTLTIMAWVADILDRMNTRK